MHTKLQPARSLDKDCGIEMLPRPYKVGEIVNCYIPIGPNEDCVITKLCEKFIRVHPIFKEGTCMYHYRSVMIGERVEYYVPPNNIYVIEK